MAPTLGLCTDFSNSPRNRYALLIEICTYFSEQVTSLILTSFEHQFPKNYKNYATFNAVYSHLAGSYKHCCWFYNIANLSWFAFILHLWHIFLRKSYKFICQVESIGSERITEAKPHVTCWRVCFLLRNCYRYCCCKFYKIPNTTVFLRLHCQSIQKCVNMVLFKNKLSKCLKKW